MKKIFVQAKQSVRILKVFTNSTPPLLLILTAAPGNGSGNSIINSWLASGGNGNSNINSPTGGREWNSNILVAPWTSLVCRRRRPLDFFSISDFAVGSGPQRCNEKIRPSNLTFAWFLLCWLYADMTEFVSNIIQNLFSIFWGGGAKVSCAHRFSLR